MAEDLPDLDESWAWAHAQVVGSATDTVPTLKGAIENAPARTVSRLVCPRRLDPDVAYIACVVPAFEVGRKAALGFPIAEQELTTLEPAWRLDQPTAPFQLPVFYSWEFTTGPEGDFESLVRDLKPRPLPDKVGTRPLDLTRPGFSLPSGGVIAMKGILKPPEPVTAEPQPVPAAVAGKAGGHPERARQRAERTGRLRTPSSRRPSTARRIRRKSASKSPPRRGTGSTISIWIRETASLPAWACALSRKTRNI